MPVVEYSVAAFRRAGFVEGSGKLVLFEPEGDPVAGLAAMAETAIEVNNAGAEALSEELYFGLRGAVPTPDGPVSPVAECEPGKALPVLLEHIADGLARRGQRGRLRPARERRSHPLAHLDGALAAVLLLPVDQQSFLSTYDPVYKQPRELGWHIDAATTRAVLTPLVEWVVGPARRVHVTLEATQVELEPAGVLDFVLDALPHVHRLKVGGVASDRVFRKVSCSWFGGVVVTSYDPGRSREHHLGELDALMRQSAADVSTAFVREGTTYSSDRNEVLAFDQPRVAFCERLGKGYWVTNHLEGDYVYDVFVEQVLTTSQLAKTGGLAPERWEVEELGGGRHRVVHREPGSWFNHTPPGEPWHRDQLAAVPSFEVQAQARADFGAAIMTAETLEEHPPAIPYEEQVRVLAGYGLTPRR